MKRKLINTKQTGRYRYGAYYGTPKCHFCARVFNVGEEVVTMGGGGRDMHRFCLDAWLKKNPPYKKGVKPAAVLKDEELDAEFARIRASLEASLKPKPVRKRTPRKG